MMSDLRLGLSVGLRNMVVRTINYFGTHINRGEIVESDSNTYTRTSTHSGNKSIYGMHICKTASHSIQLTVLGIVS